MNSYNEVESTERVTEKKIEQPNRLETKYSIFIIESQLRATDGVRHRRSSDRVWNRSFYGCSRPTIRNK